MLLQFMRAGEKLVREESGLVSSPIQGLTKAPACNGHANAALYRTDHLCGSSFPFNLFEFLLLIFSCVIERVSWFRIDL